MADNVLVSNSAASVNPDYLVWTDELVDPVSGGTVQKQLFGLVDATAAGTTRAAVGANGLAVSATIVGTVPTSGGLTDAQLRATPVPVSGTVTTTPPSNASTNITQVAGSAIAQGHGVAATAIRVELPTDGTGIVGLAAGTNGIGKLTANSGVDIGDVDVASVVPGVAATNLGKAEDAVHASGDVGVMALAVRNDAGTALAASGDYIPLMVNASGALYVTGGGGGTQYVEDTASAGGETMTLAGAVRQDTLGTSTTTDGDFVYLKTNAAGALYTETSGSVTVSGTMPVSNAGTFAVQVSSQVPGTGATNLGKAEDAAHTTGDVGVMMLGVRNDNGVALAGTTGDYIPLTTDANGKLYVTVGGLPLPSSATGAPTAFTATSSTAIFTLNNGARLRTFANDSDKDLYLMMRAAAVSTTSYHVKVPAAGGFFSTDYLGEVRGIMSAAITSGQVNCGEFT